MKKILFITYRYPFKNGPHNSFGQNIFYEVLKQNFILKGICFDDKDENDSNFINVKRKSSIIKKIFNLFILMPIRQTHYQSKLFKKCFEELIKVYSPEIIYVEHTVMMQYIKKKYPGIKILFYNDESILYLKGNNLIRGVKERIKNLYMAKAESKAICFSDVIITINDQEKLFLKERLKNKIIVTIPYGIDISYYYYNWKPDKNKIKILFLGNYDHYPNVDAIKSISRKISPHFINDVEIEFSIVGRNIKKIKSLIKPNMKVYEDVSDVREFYWNSTIFIAPIFCGGGLRTKILEAAACGIPLIISPLANLGINFENMKNAIISESIEDFIIVIKDFSINYNVSNIIRLSLNARKTIEDKFRKEIMEDKMVSLFKNL